MHKEEKISKKNLVTILSVLKKGRQYCCDRLENDSNLLLAILKNRRNPSIMNIILDQYRMDYLLHHFETLEEFNDIDNDVKDKIGGLVLQAINQAIKVNDAELSRNLIKTKQEILQSVLNSANDMEDKYNKLVLEKEKANIKYENLIEAIERGITIED